MHKKKNSTLTRAGLHLRITCLSFLLLAGCQTLAPPTNTADTNPLPSLPPLHQFHLQGKVSLKQEQNGSNRDHRASKLFTAKIRWSQSGDRYGIDLSGPLNQGHIKIVGDSRLATLWDQQANAHQADTPEQLLTQIAGVDFPLSLLTDWITGRPQQGIQLQDVTQTTLPDGSQRINQFSHKGWRIAYREWGTWEGVWLPKKMQLEDSQRKLKVFIYDWEKLSPQSEPDPS